MSQGPERTDNCTKICPAFPWMHSVMVQTPLLLEDSSIGWLHERKRTEKRKRTGDFPKSIVPRNIDTFLITRTQTPSFTPIQQRRKAVRLYEIQCRHFIPTVNITFKMLLNVPQNLPIKLEGSTSHCLPLKQQPRYFICTDQHKQTSPRVIMLSRGEFPPKQANWLFCGLNLISHCIPYLWQMLINCWRP